MWVLDFLVKGGRSLRREIYLRRFILDWKELEIWYFFKACTLIYNKRIIKVLIKLFNIGLIDRLRNFCRTGSENLAGSWQTFPPPHRPRYGTVHHNQLSLRCQSGQNAHNPPTGGGVGAGGVHSDWLEKGLCENPCFTAEWWCNEN